MRESLENDNDDMQLCSSESNQGTAPQLTDAGVALLVLSVTCLQGR